MWQGYKVYYTLTPELPVRLWTVHEVTDDSRVTTISNLLENRTYTVRLLALTTVGDGPLSPPINVSTSTGTVHQWRIQDFCEGDAAGVWGQSPQRRPL